MQVNTPCPCLSDNLYSNCCEPYLLYKRLPSSPETLMRSRYTAYFLKNYDYIVNTYANKQASTLKVQEIANASANSSWLSLKILSSFAHDNSGEVEFIALYRVSMHNDKSSHIHYDFFNMHERSRFIKEQGNWRYVDGDILAQSGQIKIGRNDRCLCNSGKKYKRCCGT